MSSSMLIFITKNVARIEFAEVRSKGHFLQARVRLIQILKNNQKTDKTEKKRKMTSILSLNFLWLLLHRK